jgi:hypothetical protein
MVLILIFQQLGLSQPYNLLSKQQPCREKAAGAEDSHLFIKK